MLETKKIIRVEHEDGWGMFIAKTSRFALAWTDHKKLKPLWERHNTENPNGGFPIPQTEGLKISKNGKEWFCSFKNIEQFKQWVKDEEVKELLKLGFKVIQLEVNEWQEGEQQILYTKESIINVEDISHQFKKK